MKHRKLVQALSIVTALIAAFPAAAQAPFPAKPIRFLVGFPPGGTNDIVARVLAPKLTEYLGQSVIVENRGGANTAIACEIFVRTPPDGHSIMLNAPGHATNPALMKLPFDSIRDFSFITIAAESQNLVVVHPSFPPRNIKELISISKRNPPGSINYGSSGTGTTVHLSAELFQFMTGVKWLHIPYKGGGPAVIDLLAGQHVIYFGNVPTVIQHARDGKLRALAVTGPKRTPAAPEIPTVAESGVPGYEVTTFYGVSAPAKTPKPIIDRLHSEVVRIVALPDVKQKLDTLGFTPVASTPEAYAAQIRSDLETWGKVVQDLGMKVE